MKVILGSDHNGFHLKLELMEYLDKHGYEVEDAGDKELNPDDDFPQFAASAVTKLIGGNDDDKAILICGSGQGMAMAANRFTGIRAALVWDEASAKSSRREDDSNVLVLPAHVIASDTANTIVESWLNTPFDNAPRRIRRLKELDNL